MVARDPQHGLLWWQKSFDEWDGSNGDGVGPIHRNVAVFALLVLYFKAALEAVHWLRSRQVLGRNQARAAIQILQSTAPLWSTFFDASHGTWRLGALLPAALAARWIYKGAVVKDPEDAEVRVLSRSSAPGELLGGPLHAAVVLAWLHLRRFHRPDEAALVASALAVSDGWAPFLLGYGPGGGVPGGGGALSGVSGALSGRRGASGRAGGGGFRLIQSALTFAAVAVLAVLCDRAYRWILGVPPAPLGLALFHSGIVALSWALFPGLDTLAAPAALLFLVPRLSEWWPST